jgi:hypothetical protein
MLLNCFVYANAWGQNLPELLQWAEKVMEYRHSDLSFVGTVIVPFDPECPVCKDSGEELKRLAAEYPEFRFYLVLVHPNERIISAAKTFAQDFRGTVTIDNGICKMLNAKVTPEVFVLDSALNVRYSGAIDNYFYKLGRRRAKPTQKYLEDALDAVRKSEFPKIKRVEPIGCYIEP